MRYDNRCWMLRPSIVFFCCYLQIVIAYVLAMDVAAEMYGVPLGYSGLLLWTISFLVLAGVSEVVARFYARKDAVLNSDLFLNSLRNISSARLRVLLSVSIPLISFTTASIIAFYGGAPLILVAVYGLDQGDFNAMQADSTPGLFGAHALFIALTEIVLALIFIRKIAFSERIGFGFLACCLLVVAATLIDGKRQGMVVFFVLLGISLFYCILLGLVDERRIKKWLLLFFVVMSMVFSIFYLVTDSRLNAAGFNEYSFSAFYEPLRYLCLPLVNIEYLYGIFGLSGDFFDFIKPLEFLLPAKFLETRGALNYILPEPTSPMGIFAASWLWWGGVWGIVVYMGCVGILSFFVYTKSLKSPFFAILYGYVFWDLFASHTYNHFVTITYFPMQFICVLFVLWFVRVGGR